MGCRREQNSRRNFVQDGLLEPRTSRARRPSLCIRRHHGTIGIAPQSTDTRRTRRTADPASPCLDRWAVARRYDQTRPGHCPRHRHHDRKTLMRSLGGWSTRRFPLARRCRHSQMPTPESRLPPEPQGTKPCSPSQRKSWSVAIRIIPTGSTEKEAPSSRCDRCAGCITPRVRRGYPKESGAESIWPLRYAARVRVERVFMVG
jgi:hypothetical protein